MATFDSRVYQLTSFPFTLALRLEHRLTGFWVTFVLRFLSRITASLCGEKPWYLFSTLTYVVRQAEKRNNRINNSRHAFGGHWAPGTIVFATGFFMKSYDGPDYNPDEDEPTGLLLLKR